MECIETEVLLANIFAKALDVVTFIKFRDMLLVSGSFLNLVVKKSKEPEMNYE